SPAAFHLSFVGQPIAHTDGLWNFLGMALVGLGSVMLGGCPLRQLILAGSGSSDAGVAVLGMVVGAAFCHNFGLASSGDGPTLAGRIAVIIGFAVAGAIAAGSMNRKKA
ncbi:MAG: YedE-related selenium metabolism membrane protein, partial [Pseudoflavonifractor sp.]